MEIPAMMGNQVGKGSATCVRLDLRMQLLPPSVSKQVKGCQHPLISICLEVLTTNFSCELPS